MAYIIEAGFACFASKNTKDVYLEGFTFDSVLLHVIIAILTYGLCEFCLPLF